MKPKSWVILTWAIEEGLRGALWNENIQTPKNNQDCDYMVERLMSRIETAISEKFDFDD